MFACTLCALREKEREKEFGRALWEQKPLLESVQNNKCASGGMLRLALLQHVSRCWSAASGDFPTFSGEFCSALDAVSSLYFKQLHCFLWLCSLIRCFFVVVYFTLPAWNRLLCLLSFLKIIIDIWKTVKLLVCCLFCVVHTLRFSDFQGCQIFTQASVLINTLLINDLIANPSLSSEKSPETLQNGACVFLVVLLDVL